MDHECWAFGNRVPCTFMGQHRNVNYVMCRCGRLKLLEGEEDPVILRLREYGQQFEQKEGKYARGPLAPNKQKNDKK